MAKPESEDEKRQRENEMTKGYRERRLANVATVFAALVEDPKSGFLLLPLSHDRWAQVAALYDEGGMPDTAERIRQYIKKEIGL